MKLDLKVIGPMTFAERDALIETKEFNDPVREYIETIMKLAEKDLSFKNKQLYRKIMHGKLKQNPKNKKVHSAVMWSIGMGLG